MSGVLQGVLLGSAGAPTLNFDFIGSATLPSLVTFTRASTATYFDSAGVLQSASNDVARFDYNPSTLAARGLLIEESRTNSIRNNTMQGAVAGTPGTLPTNWSVSGLGTLTQQVVGTGTTNGVTWIDVKLSGTTSTTTLSIIFDSISVIAAANGQTWAQSVWTAVVAGSTANITATQLTANLFDSGGGYLANLAYSTPNFNTTSVLTRSSGAGTISTVGTAFIRPILALAFSSGVAIDITLRIGLPQLEQGAFATSVIPTTTTALTRAADVASVNTLTPWFNATTGTVFGEWNSFANSTGRYVVDIEQAASSNDRIDININTSNVVNPRTVVGGAAIASLSGGTYTVNTNAKVAFAYASADYASSLNGASAVTATTAGVLPSSLARMFIGSLAGATQINGHLRRIQYFPRRLANAELQAITA